MQRSSPSVKKVPKDKQSTRKRKGVAKVANQNKKLKSRRFGIASEDEENTQCLYCKATYRESVEGWIQCTGRCKLWAHNFCAGVDSQGPTSFMCEFCNDN